MCKSDMCKSDMWKLIQEKAKSDPIIAKAMQGYENETLEDQAQVLMAIVLDQAAALNAMQLSNSRMQEDYYLRKNAHRSARDVVDESYCSARSSALDAARESI